MGVDRGTAGLVAALLVASAATGAAVGAVVVGRDRDRPAAVPSPAGTPLPGPAEGVGEPAPTSATPSPDCSTPGGFAGSAGAGPGRLLGPGEGALVGPSAPGCAAPTPSAGTVPVYVVGGTGAGSRLYREFRAAGSPDAVASAVAWLARAPADPDYRSGWAGRAAAVSRAGSVVTVRFTAGAIDARLAREQVVWTVTAADRSVTRVRVVAPGLPDRPAAGRGDQAGVLGPVWVLAPADGATAGGPLTVSGTASVFEATVSVEVRRGAAVVARATATASVGAPGRGSWSTRFTLPPGAYVVAAYEVSEKDGARVGVDTKRVTVSGR
jgi:hypothetical protein